MCYGVTMIDIITALVLIVLCAAILIAGSLLIAHVADLMFADSDADYFNLTEDDI